MLRSALFVGLFLVAGLASAATKISLVTVTPGPVIFDAFGHTAILVENTEDPSDTFIYSYGAVDPRRVLMGANPLPGFQKLFEQKIETAAYKSATTLDGETKFPSALAEKYFGNAAQPNPHHREVTITPLELTEEQAVKLRGLIDDDIMAAMKEPRKIVDVVDLDATVGKYYYRNFDANCATRMRDRLFNAGVLGAQPALKNEMVDISLKELAEQSIDEALTLNPGMKLSLLPTSMASNARIAQNVSMVGIPRTDFASGADFHAAILETETNLKNNGMLKMMVGPAMFNSLLETFHNYFFGPTLVSKPTSRYATLYLPKNLRAALLDVVNPATGKPVVGDHETHTVPGEHAKPIVAVRDTHPTKSE